MPGLQVSPAVANCRPSAKLVHLILDQTGPVQHGELQARTGLSYSTLRAALDVLEDAGVIETLPDPEDGRSRVYQVKEG